jgi:HK97 family phage major capsid protein
MNPEELKRLIDAKLTESRAVIAQAQASGRLTLNEEETAKFQAIQQDITDAKATLAILETQAAQDAWAREPARAAVLPEPSAAPPTPSQAAPFAGMGDFLQAVARSSNPQLGVDRRLLLPSAGPTGMNELYNADGGYLVDKQMSNDLLTSTYETGLLVGRVRHLPIGENYNGTKLNMVDETSRAEGSRWGGVVAYWTGEGEEKLASRPKFRQEELTLEKLTGLCYVTDETLQDAPLLEQIVREAFANEFGFKLDDAIIRGTGAGMPLGILNSPAKVEVAAESGQVAGTIVFENIINMWSRLPARSMASPNTVWLVNPAIFPQLATMGFSVGTGGIPVWMPAGGISGNPFSTLMGRPVVPIEQASALGTVGDLILADLSQYVMIDKGGIQTASSIHVRFVYDETAFRWVLRTDGQPGWTSPITPAQGSSTVSPFVTLATRA